MEIEGKKLSMKLNWVMVIFNRGKWTLFGLAQVAQVFYVTYDEAESSKRLKNNVLDLLLLRTKSELNCDFGMIF